MDTIGIGLTSRMPQAPQIEIEIETRDEGWKGKVDRVILPSDRSLTENSIHRRRKLGKRVLSIAFSPSLR